MLANMDPVSAKQLKDCEFQFQVKGLNFPFQKCCVRMFAWSTNNHHLMLSVIKLKEKLQLT